MVQIWSIDSSRISIMKGIKSHDLAEGKIQADGTPKEFTCILFLYNNPLI
jgi:hypothetical protein